MRAGERVQAIKAIFELLRIVRKAARIAPMSPRSRKAVAFAVAVRRAMIAKERKRLGLKAYRRRGTQLTTPLAQLIAMIANAQRRRRQ